MYAEHMEMILVLAGLMFAVAAVYASIGHGGASAYLGIMALAGVAPEVMRPTALVLNIIVAGIASWRFVRAGWFSLPVLWPFLVTAAPMAFLGGMVHLPGHYYRPLVGIVLLFAAFRLFFPENIRMTTADARPPVVSALIVGAGMGFLSGLTGVGGGIFLSPLLIAFGWADARKVAGVSAMFIFVNSIAGLGGNLTGIAHLPAGTPYLAIAVIVGALVGTTFSISAASRPMLLRANAAVLTIAGVKMVFI